MVALVCDLRQGRPPFRACEFEITYGTSMSFIEEVVDLASEAPQGYLVTRRRSIIACQGVRLGCPGL
jgi:hypothetical protein